ncbi:hypothetical protein [Flavobacterium luminosum]|uniref:30S ribosomal protein S20 n=1 Tax=Flavobacterium luminosum TaxID=2949086 RepID=A0ABT0TQP2_9FLAO|nr:hypothetical protein [Flavobacterium sp. HXWNR70]MCL9809809.1 hypothetical protein [Flavobacterium sp. HXWNR70]
MSRKNQENIKKYNDKLHKAKSKDKIAKVERKAQLKAILKKSKESEN